jgi:hypothetical protein
MISHPFGLDLANKQHDCFASYQGFIPMVVVVKGTLINWYFLFSNLATLPQCGRLFAS